MIKKSYRMQLRLTEDQKARLLQMADEQGLTMSALISKLILEEWVKGPNRTVETKARNEYYGL